MKRCRQGIYREGLSDMLRSLDFILQATQREQIKTKNKCKLGGRMKVNVRKMNTRTE